MMTAKPTMKLITLHGRNNPEQPMNDWGFDGPDIDGIVALHVTYNATHVLHFATVGAAKKAAEITGWEVWDNRALSLQFRDDMLYMPARGEYYGDWEIQTLPGYLNTP